MPSAKPRGRRQQKVALERQLRAAGMWEQFVRAREKLKSVNIPAASAWDLLTLVFRKMLAQMAAGQTHSWDEPLK